MIKLSTALLRRANSAAAEHRKLSDMITAAFLDRYGKTHSEVDCDSLIDALDYGSGYISSLAECDRQMELCGVTTLKKRVALSLTPHDGKATP